MKYILAIFAMLFPVVMFSQTTVNYNAALYDVGMAFTTRTIDDASFDPGPSGAGSWNFTPFTDGDESDFSVVAYDGSIPHIGDCVETPNYIVYYHDTTDTSETEGWLFSKVTAPTRVCGLGLYGTMESGGTDYALSAINDSYTPSDTFPIGFGASWIEAIAGHGTMSAGIISIDYTYQDTNWYHADGWGQIILPIGTFDALRVTKRHWEHSHSDDFFFGFDKTVRDFTYMWLCTDLGSAVSFKGPTDSTGGMPDPTFTTGKLTLQIANSTLAVSENPLPTGFGLSVYPNPFNSAVKITIAGGVGASDARSGQVGVQIFDITGHLVADLPVTTCGSPQVVPTPRIWQPEKSISSGIYLVRARVGERETTKRVVYLK